MEPISSYSKTMPKCLHTAGKVIAIYPQDDGTCNIALDCASCRSIVVFTGCFPVSHSYDVFREALEGMLQGEKIGVSVPRGEPHEFTYEPFRLPEEDDDGSQADN